MKKQGLVSIIVPVYKVNQSLVTKCINSILEQSYRDVEIIMVDDGNDDAYAMFLNTFSDLDKRIKIVTHKNNQGLFQSRITGVNSSNGKYIAFVDADDYIGIDWIRLLVKKAEETKADIVMGRTVIEDENHSKYVFNSNYSICSQHEKEGKEIFEYLIKDCGLDFSIHTVWNKLYTRTLWNISMHDLKRVKKHLIMTEDILFSSILFYYAQKMTFSNHDGYFYYRNDNSSTVGKMDLKKCEKNIEDLECVFSTLKAFMCDNDLLSKYEEYYNEWKKRYFRWWSYTISEVSNSLDEKQAEELVDKFFHAFDEKELVYASEEDGYFSQKRTPWNDSLEIIKKKICDSEIKAVSFDLFDTLIVRPVLNPEDVYHFVVNEVNTGSYSEKVIIKYRNLAEEYARRSIKNININYEDVTLTEIYDIMHSRYGIPKDICSNLKAKEEAIELEFAMKRNIGAELYSLALEIGKKVFITSDMYLEKDVIGQILEKNGYIHHNDTILSSETRLLKASGKSYSLLVEKANCLNKQVLHIGDNWNADVMVPREKGIQTFFMPKTKDILLNYLGDKYTGNAFGDALENAVSIIDKSKYFENFAVRCICAVVANVMFDNPFVSYNEESDYNGDPYQLGVVALGPHMLGICKWLLDLSEERGAEQVHFSSRDGFYIKQIYDYIINKYNIKQKTNYLHISRKAFIPIEIKDIQDVLGIYGNCSIYANTPNSIIQRYHKVLRPLDSEIKKYYIEKGFQLDEGFQDEEQFICFLHEMSQKQFSKKKASYEYMICKDYLRLSEVNDNDIIFDLGYSGKLHKDIVECTEKKVLGAYISTDGYGALERIDENQLMIMSYYDFVPSMQGIVNEYIFSDRAPSCLGYKKNDGVISVEFEDKMKDYIGDYVINEINRGAFTFVKTFVDIFQNRMNYIKLLPLDAGLLYEKFLVSPKPFDKAIFDCCLIEDDFYGGIRERRLTEVWDWQIRDRRLEKKEQIVYVNTTSEEKSEEKSENEVDMEWEVYKAKVIHKSLFSKALYWMCVNRDYFKIRIKDYLNVKENK
ncbi:MAG: glycosyltransferase [Lachnospiraceae bacterium]|nr:glycosyltransferase [Lachnospiraceae bacterium]